MAPFVGACALATKLVGWFYGRQAGPGGACHGPHCFRCVVGPPGRGFTHLFIARILTA